MRRAARTYEGKAKRVSTRSDEEVAIFYKDDATAFNGIKHEIFPGKGALNSKITELLFHHLERSNIPTHHLGRLDERTLVSRNLAMFPLEIVVRFQVAGSLAKRTGLPDGTLCDPPVVETYYKRDDLGDPMLNDDHVRLLGAATAPELGELRRLSLEAAVTLRQLFARAQIELFDMKLEFGKTLDGRIVVADEISPDTCRFRDAGSGTILDKDRFRRNEGDLLEGYRELLARLERALTEGVN